MFRTLRTTTNRSKLSVFNWSLFLFISPVELQSVRLRAASALITGCDRRSLLSATQPHKSMGKATFPTPETSPVEHSKPIPYVPIPWKTRGMVKGGRIRPGTHQVIPLCRICSSSRASLSILLVLERQLHTLLLMGMLVYHSFPRDTSQGHILLAWLTRKASLKVAGVTRAALDPPSPPRLCCAALQPTAACGFL